MTNFNQEVLLGTGLGLFQEHDKTPDIKLVFGKRSFGESPKTKGNRVRELKDIRRNSTLSLWCGWMYLVNLVQCVCGSGVRVGRLLTGRLMV